MNGMMFGEDDFPWRLMRARTAANMTQSDLADRAAISARNVSLYENGHARPHGATMRKLAAALDMDVGFLANGQTTANQNYLARRYTEGNGRMIPHVKQVWIETWEEMRHDKPLYVGLQYAAKPERANQSSDVTLFAHYVCRSLGDFRATRYPKFGEENPEYPAGTVIVFDAGPCSPETVKHGEDLIYSLTSEPDPVRMQMRRVVRATDSTEVMLASPNPKVPPILYDELEIKVLGVVVSKVQSMRE